MKVLEVIERVSRDLVDLRFVRWSKDELIDFLNDAVAAVLIRRPDLSRITTEISHTSNRVDLPADAYCLLSVNFIDSIAAQYVNIEKLNHLYPRWRVTEGDPTCWTKNIDDQKSFWLYPAPKAAVQIEYSYSKMSRVTEVDEFPIPSIYEGLVVDFIMYRAFSKDAENASESGKASLHFQSFTVALGDKNSTDALKSEMINQSLNK